MRVTLGGHLWKMGDGEDLHVLAHRANHPSHLVGHATGHSRVNLIEYERRHIHELRHHGLQAEHQTGHLATGSALRDINRIGA